MKDLKNLSADEMARLKQVYGAKACGADTFGQPRILYVRELSAFERQFFGRRFVSPYLFEQTLYKVRGKLLPNKLNRAIREMVATSEAFRSNYVDFCDRSLCVIFDSRPDFPLPNYRNLEQTDEEDLDAAMKQAMATDMREKFDLVHGNLARFSVFHTGKDEYAILVTVARLIADSFDVATLLRSAMEDIPYKPLATQKKLSENYLMSDSVKDYWRRIFADFPPPTALPYSKENKEIEYNQKSFRLAIPAALSSDLRREAKNNRSMLMALFLTAWGITLGQADSDKEIGLCLLLPEDSGAGGVRIVPIRYGLAQAGTCGQAVNAMFQKILVSRSYAKFGWSGLNEVAPEQGEFFDHFLSFADFFEENTGYTQTAGTPSGNIVMKNAYDSQGMPLSVYFHDNGGNISVSFLYDEEYFQPRGIPKLASRYLLTLLRLLTDWNLSAVQFSARMAERIERQEKDEIEKAQESRAALQDTISKIPFLQGATLGTLQEFLQWASTTTYFEGDRIFGKEIEENILLVSKGVLQRNMDAGDGWYNMLDLVGENEWINETALLRERSSHVAAEVISEEATLVRIPVDKMQEILSEKPEIKDRLLQHVLSEMEKYQKRWVQS